MCCYECSPITASSQSYLKLAGIKGRFLDRYYADFYTGGDRPKRYEVKQSQGEPEWRLDNPQACH
jgi:hypothetical protein